MTDTFRQAEPRCIHSQCHQAGSAKTNAGTRKLTNLLFKDICGKPQVNQLLPVIAIPWEAVGCGGARYW